LICLFGGTFDPIHIGHIHAAETVCAALGIEEIRMVLSARPSHKDATGGDVNHRWEMLQLACRDHSRLIPDDREVNRVGPSYTVDTLVEVREAFPSQAVVWVIGSDAFALLPAWHRWREVLQLANLVVLKRPGHPLELDPVMEDLSRVHRVESLSDRREGGILMLDNEMAEVASEDIRRGIAGGRDMTHLLPEPVAHYIRLHGLYGG